MNYFQTIHVPRRLPQRKCIIVLCMILLIFVIFKRDSSLPITKEVKDWHTFLGLDNPGFLGEPVELADNLSEQLKQRIQDGWEKFSYNEFVSSLIPLDRFLPDIRSEYCKNVKYSKNLPKATIVIIFHNESWSMLLRTIHSILNRSTKDLVEGITLVDDCSDMGKNLNEFNNLKLHNFFALKIISRNHWMITLLITQR